MTSPHDFDASRPGLWYRGQEEDAKGGRLPLYGIRDADAFSMPDDEPDDDAVARKEAASHHWLDGFLVGFGSGFLFVFGFLGMLAMAVAWVQN